MEEYMYKGVELIPSVFKELMILLFDGKQFQRSTAIDTITEYHQAHGGILQKGEYVTIFKAACQLLKGNGLVSVAYGTWKLNYQVKETEIVSQQDNKTIACTADKTIGHGDNAVYVYYFDIYKKMADLEKRDVFECKIGKTNGDAFQRVLSQTGTCYPEAPHVALIILCENSSLLETTLHNILKMKNRHISSAPGVEWFMTSPEEVEEIYTLIV